MLILTELSDYGKEFANKLRSLFNLDKPSKTFISGTLKKVIDRMANDIHSKAVIAQMKYIHLGKLVRCFEHGYNDRPFSDLAFVQRLGYSEQIKLVFHEAYEAGQEIRKMTTPASKGVPASDENDSDETVSDNAENARLALSALARYWEDRYRDLLAEKETLSKELESAKALKDSTVSKAKYEGLMRYWHSRYTDLRKQHEEQVKVNLNLMGTVRDQVFAVQSDLKKEQENSNKLSKKVKSQSEYIQQLQSSLYITGIGLGKNVIIEQQSTIKQQQIEIDVLKKKLAVEAYTVKGLTGELAYKESYSKHCVENLKQMTDHARKLEAYITNIPADSDKAYIAELENCLKEQSDTMKWLQDTMVKQQKKIALQNENIASLEGIVQQLLNRK